MEYCITSDDDGHDYIVPANHLNEWHRWVENASDYWRCGSKRPDNEPVPELPLWAIEIDGSISNIRFSSYHIVHNL